MALLLLKFPIVKMLVTVMLFKFEEIRGKMSDPSPTLPKIGMKRVIVEPLYLELFYRLLYDALIRYDFQGLRNSDL